MNKSFSLFGINVENLQEYEKNQWESKTLTSFKSLQSRAREVDIKLTAISVFRDYEAQLAIWNLKCDGERAVLDSHSNPIDIKELSPKERIFAILRWSALPGLSRHHWGTDFDIIDSSALEKNPDYKVQLIPNEYRKGGVFENLGDFLRGKLEGSDFFRPYAKDLGGVAPEPWHLSYKPVAQEYFREMTLSRLTEFCKSDQFKRCRFSDIVIENLDVIYEQFFLTISD